MSDTYAFHDHFEHQGTVPCAFSDHAEAVGIFYAPEGCICKEDKVQALCAQHALKAQQNGVDLRVICWL
jgi:hypothetical protein